MQFLLGESTRKREVRELAFPYAFERARQGELRWRSGPRWNQRFENFERLADLVDAKHPVIISHGHHGHFYDLIPNLNRQGILGVYFLGADRQFNGETDASVDAARGRIVDNGNLQLRARGSYAFLVEILRQGRLCSIAWDVPGSCPIEFLGRRVSIASGTARLALETGAAIVPVTTHRDASSSTGQFFRVGEPIETTDRSVSDIMQSIADRFTESFLDWPEALQPPMERWHLITDASPTASVVQPA